VAGYQATPPQPPAALFDYLHAVLPAALAAQRREVVEGSGDHG
jgi:hypothetical protein